MPPKKVVKRGIPDEGSNLVDSELASALSKRINQKASSLLTKYSTKQPEIFSITDERLYAFTGRAVDMDIDTTVVKNHKPLALTDAVVIQFTTDSDLLLDPSAIFLCLKCSIKRYNENNALVQIPKPKMRKKYIGTAHEQTQLTQKEVTIGGQKVPLLETKMVAAAKEIDEIFDSDGVTPAPLFPLTLWKNCRLKLGKNEVEIPNSTKDMYHFQAYIKWLLTVNKDTVEQLERNALFILDDSPSIDPFTNKDALQRRYIASANSRVMQFYVPMFCDGLTSILENRFLPPDLPITLELEKASNDLCLTSNKENERYHISIEELYLQCRYTKLSEQALSAFDNIISRMSAFYTYTQHSMSYRLIPAGSTSFRLPLSDAIQKTLPEKIIGAFISWKAFNGNLGENAFWFESKNIKKITVTREDGRKISEVETKWLGPTVAMGSGNVNQLYNQMYNQLLTELNVSFLTGSHNLLSYESFEKGRFIFALDTTRNHRADTHETIAVNDKTEIAFEWFDRTPEDLVVVLMYLDTKGIAINANREVSLMTA